MKRIKEGELVELSAAGKRLQQNADVVGLFGVVFQYAKLDQHPYKIDWYNLDGTVKKFPMARYEIKRLKGAK